MGDNLVKIHGNWCGPNWTGGQRVSAQDYTGPWDGPAISPLDQACRAHDFASRGGKTPRTADTALIQAARKRILSDIEYFKLQLQLVNPFIDRSRRVKIVKRLRESDDATLVVAGITIARPFRST